MVGYYLSCPQAKKKKMIRPRHVLLPRDSRFPGQNEIVPDDYSVMVWKVVCAQPIRGDEWALVHPGAVAVGDLFSVDLVIADSLPLPTRFDAKVACHDVKRTTFILFIFSLSAVRRSESILWPASRW